MREFPEWYRNETFSTGWDTQELKPYKGYAVMKCQILDGKGRKIPGKVFYNISDGDDDFEEDFFSLTEVKQFIDNFETEKKRRQKKGGLTMMKWYVESRIDDRGRIEAEVWSEDEIQDKTPFTHYEEYDRYVDAFDDLGEAQAFCRDARNA